MEKNKIYFNISSYYFIKNAITFIINKALFLLYISKIYF